MAVASDIIRLPTPGAFHPRLLKMRRAALEAWIERAITLLDELDGDPDAEDDGSAEMNLQYEIRGGAVVRAA